MERREDGQRDRPQASPDPESGAARPSVDPDPGADGGTAGDGEAPAHAADARPGDEALARSLALVRFLRRGCPWDARQTPESLRPYLLEEARETADAILAGDDDALAGELGDLLLNLAFQIVVAEEREAFDAGEVVRRLEAKMEARHPHVYGEAEEPPDWEEMKAREREAAPERGDGDSGGPFEGVPEGLEPLSRSLRVQHRAAGLGFDWPDVSGAVAKLREEIRELEELLEARRRTEAGDGTDAAARAGGTVPDEELEEEVGDLLFAAVNVARLASAHPSPSLERATAKFERRFRELARRARERGLDLDEASLEEMEAVWREVKGEEGGPG